MAGITFPTLSTTVDQFVEKFSARERKPIDTLKEKKTTLSRKSAVLADLKTKLQTLRTRAKGFTAVGTEAKLAAKTAVSSNESIFSVSADATAETGVNTLFVSRIARNDLAVSDSFKSSDTSIAEKFFGTTQQFSIQIGSGTTETISLSFSDESESNSSVFSRIAEAINNAVDNVSVTVITSQKNKNRITIVSDESGSENLIALADVGDSVLLEELGFITSSNESRKTAGNTKGGFITPDADELDAIFEVNGIEITSSSNTVTGVVTGVTIQLRKAQEAGSAPETFTISPDPDEIKAQIQSFIEDFNASLSFLTEKTSIDVQKNERGVLANNIEFRSLRLRLREIVSEQVSGVEAGNPSLLSEIGITIKNNGSLTIDDEDKLDAALAENAEGVTALFTSENGIANKLTDELNNFIRAGTAIDRNASIIRTQTTTVDRQIAGFESRFKIRENTLRNQFAQLEKSLALLQSQQTALQRFGFTSNPFFQFGNFLTFGQKQTLF